MIEIKLQNNSSIVCLQSNGNTVRSRRAYKNCSNCGNYEFCTDDDKEIGMCFLNYNYWEEKEDEE